MNKNENIEVACERDEDQPTESQLNVKELTDSRIGENKEKENIEEDNKKENIGEDNEKEDIGEDNEKENIGEDVVKENVGEDVVKESNEEEEGENKLSSKDVLLIDKSSISEYLLCSINTWEPEEMLNISNSSAVDSYSSLHLKYKDVIKIDEDEDETIYVGNHNMCKNNTSKRKRNKKRKLSTTQMNMLENKDHKDKIKSSVKLVKKKTTVEQMYANDMERSMLRKRKKTESMTRKKLTSTEPSSSTSHKLTAKSLTTKKLTEKSLTTKKIRLGESSTTKKLTLTESLTRKRLKVIKKSKMDIMLRRKKSEVIKDLRKYKDEEMKNIDSEVKGMKRDLLSYMLKEVEEHKKEMLVNMEKGIEEEKNRRLNILELELASKVYNDKSIQTINYPETVDEKYEEILKELKVIKCSSNLCKNILTKQSPLNLKSKDSPQPFNSSSKRSHNSFASLDSSSILSISQDSISTPQSSTQHPYRKNSRDWLSKISRKSEGQSFSKENNNKNFGIPLENTALGYKNVKNSANAMSSKELFSGENFPNSSYDDISSYNKKLPINSPENSILYHRYRSPQENIKVQMNNQRSPQEDTALYNHSLSLHCQENIPFNKNLPSQDNNALYIMVPKDNTSNKQSTSQENDPSYMKNLPFLAQQNILTPNNSSSPQQNTALYIKNLLSSEENTSLCNHASTIPTENTASYIKNLLITSQLGSPQENSLSKISHNVTIPHGKHTHHTKPTLISSQDTALYIKNLLMSSHDNASSNIHNSSNLQKKSSNVFNKSSPISSLEGASLYTRPNSQQNDTKLLGNKKMVFPNTENTAYNIYTYNKNLISSQENSMLYNRNVDDIATLTVRKKREINKRIFEKYGPLHNPKEISEKIQCDPIFLSLPTMEKNGLLSCLTRSVAEHLTFSKDLLEELFSREVLSISSCKGSPIKTALNADKLALIKKIVFFALPSDDEEALWEMIQDCIDTKCRGILRNMKKKLSKQSFEC